MKRSRTSSFPADIGIRTSRNQSALGNVGTRSIRKRACARNVGTRSIRKCSARANIGSKSIGNHVAKRSRGWKTGEKSAFPGNAGIKRNINGCFASVVGKNSVPMYGFTGFVVCETFFQPGVARSRPIFQCGVSIFLQPPMFGQALGFRGSEGDHRAMFG